jgi:flagellar biosynthetic protein FliR
VGGLAASLSVGLPFFFLGAIRVGITMAALPAPFGAGGPAIMRLVLSLLITMVLCIPHIGTSPPIPLEPTVLAQHALAELFVGGVIGMTVRVMLAAAEIAGSAIGQVIGLGFASTVDPNAGDTVLPTTTLLGVLAMLIFFELGGHHTLIAALGQSFATVPIAHELGSISSAGVTQIGAGMMARGMQIASPVIATMFIVQLGTALAARAAPRVHLLAFSFSVVVAAGILALFVAAPSVFAAIGAELGRVPEALSAIVGEHR